MRLSAGSIATPSSSVCPKLQAWKIYSSVIHSSSTDFKFLCHIHLTVQLQYISFMRVEHGESGSYHMPIRLKIYISWQKREFVCKIKDNISLFISPRSYLILENLGTNNVSNRLNLSFRSFFMVYGREIIFSAPWGFIKWSCELRNLQ